MSRPDPHRKLQCQTSAPSRGHSSVFLSSIAGPYPSNGTAVLVNLPEPGWTPANADRSPLDTPVGHPCRISVSSPAERTRAARASPRMANCSPPDAISVPSPSACASSVRPTAVPMTLTCPSSSRLFQSGSVAAATSPLNVSSNSVVSLAQRVSPQHSCTQDSIQTGTLTIERACEVMGGLVFPGTPSAARPARRPVVGERRTLSLCEYGHRCLERLDHLIVRIKRRPSYRKQRITPSWQQACQSASWPT